MTICELLTSNSPKLRKIVTFIAFQYHQDADDIFQDLTIKLLRYQTNINGRPLPEHLAYASRMCWNMCTDKYRKGRITTIPIEDTWYLGESQLRPSRLDDRQHLAHLYLGIRQNFSRHHAYVMYRLAQGWRYEDIAVDTKFSMSKVKTMIHKVRKVIVR